jgi:ankyrin repeat protein
MGMRGVGVLIGLTVFVAGGGGCASHTGVGAAQHQRALNQRLILAAYAGDAREVGRLLKAGAWGDAWFGGTKAERNHAFGSGGYAPVGSNRWTALHAVAEAPGSIDRVTIARLLLDAGAQPDADDGYGATPLYSAVRNDYEPLAMFLMDRGAAVETTTHAYIDGPEGSPLEQAIRNRNVRLVSALIAHGANVYDTGGGSPLTLAAGVRCVECAKLLLAAGAEVDGDPEVEGPDRTTPLINACRWYSTWEGARKGESHADMVRLLLEAGAKVNARALIKDTDDATVVTRIETPLLNAAKACDVPTMKLLVAAGADVRVANEENCTPLHLVMVPADDLSLLETAVRLLVDAGADLTVKSKDGETPLDAAPYTRDGDSAERVQSVNRIRELLTPKPATRPAHAFRGEGSFAPSRPAVVVSASIAVTSSTIFAGSLMRPVPTLRQASQPGSGPIMR